MPLWIIRLKKGAEEDLSGLDKVVRIRIFEKLAWLEENFDNVLPQSLSGKLSGYYKLRVGDWRVIYLVNQETKEISIIAIGHRKDIYNLLQK